MLIKYVNPFHYFDQIYLINLDRRVDRLSQTLEEFEKVGIVDYQRVSGIEHSNPAIGCHLSHALVFSDALINGYDRILIFEDDVEFFPQAVYTLEESLKELNPEWDMLYLGANLDIFPAYQISKHTAKLIGAFSTHAHAIRRKMFKTLYDINVREDTKHNDVTYSQDIHPNYKCYMSIPLIAGQRDSYSDIMGTVMSSNSMMEERLEKNLVRL